MAFQSSRKSRILSFEYNHLKETRKYKVFKDNLSLNVSGDRDLKVLKELDMVFFPVLTQKDIYLIFINLKKPAFEVIDNGTDDADFDDKYGPVFKPLINHVKENEMADKNLRLVRLVMSWRTVYNSLDYGVFAMRHMESYFREKATILTYEINTKRDDVLKVANEYQNVDPKICCKHSYHAQ
uniref:Ubiquitin-like protease family profile domain-containing protein n=1 Tax=Lactuca sativa TaxID=4236 RepID=A0A9R1V6T8_LACSA|nr:hypothetical protein LSAT_V11C600313950 [Lactuca sativa]